MTLVAVFIAVMGAALHCLAEQTSAKEFRQVKVERLVRDPRSAQPVVILSDLKEERGMLIWIGEAEALALEAARQKVAHRRPLTHDLLLGIMERLNARLVEVRIAELKDDIFYARVFLETPSGQVDVDARPSDAMVLAVKVGCPILVAASLFESRGIPLEMSHTRRYGLEVQELSDDLKTSLGYGGEGVLISSVAPGSSAEKDGFRREDIIVKVEQRSIKDAGDLEEAIAGIEGEFQVQIFRSGGFLNLRVTQSQGP